MRLTFENARPIAQGIWTANVESEEIRGFAPRSASSGRTSILALANPSFDKTSKTLSISLSGLEVLAVGAGNYVILVDQSLEDRTTDEERVATVPTPSGSHDKIRYREFEEFISACKAEGLSTDLIEAVRSLLNEMRRLLPFTLAEGKARKWTADPNFIAITIQNRNKQLLISVKGDHRKMNYRTIKPVAGRGLAYSEFHFNSADQFGETLDAVRKSANV